MPTIIGILTFMSRINFKLSLVEHEKKFYNLRAWLQMTKAGLFNKLPKITPKLYNTVKTLYNVTRYNRISNIRHKYAGNGSVSLKIPSL